MKRKIILFTALMLIISSCSTAESSGPEIPQGYEIVGLNVIDRNNVYKLREIETGCLILFASSVRNYPITATTIKCP